jgi:hypothetical protein
MTIRLTFIRTSAAALLGLVVAVTPASAAPTARICAQGRDCAVQAFSPGVTATREPSGLAPLRASALPGFRRVFVDDFHSNHLSNHWSLFAGEPGGDPGAQWSPSHVRVSGGVLTLNAWRDAGYGGRWVTGGLCACQHPQTYGAFFVRARLSGPGATFVGLLWPTMGWPPEIDFTETYGSTSHSMATVHFGSRNAQRHSEVQVDMTRWHTWGVIWTPRSIIFTLDGVEWGRVSSRNAIPRVPMTLHLQQQTWCALNFACPSTPDSVQIDWVEIFRRA